MSFFYNILQHDNRQNSRLFKALINKPFCPDFPSVLLLIFALSPQPANALPQEDAVSRQTGGRIVRLPQDNSSSRPLVSFMAIQDKGYRFDGWDGDCANTLGTLCTLDTVVNDRVSARFVKIKTPETATKALLLLQDAAARPTLWNEFVRQHFDNRCPVIYGGVLLGPDSFNPGNRVYCYRIAFGYYDPLKSVKSQQAENDTPDTHNDYASHEITAAVLGILNRHPQLSLTLVSQQNITSAAQPFLQSDAAKLSDFVALIVLRQAGESFAEQLADGWVSGQNTPVLSLEANPRQGAKIGTALSLLTKSWWINP